MTDSRPGREEQNGSFAGEDSVSGLAGGLGLGGGAGRKRVRDSTNGLTASTSSGAGLAGGDVMRDDLDGDPFDVDMEAQAALEQAERDGDIAGVASPSASWPSAQASLAQAAGAVNGVPFYPDLGGADLDDEYDLDCAYYFSFIVIW
jgi:hypothetical protein